jgi:hypothetical protein
MTKKHTSISTVLPHGMTRGDRVQFDGKTTRVVVKSVNRNSFIIRPRRWYDSIGELRARFNAWASWLDRGLSAKVLLFLIIWAEFCQILSELPRALLP